VPAVSPAAANRSLEINGFPTPEIDPGESYLPAVRADVETASYVK